MSDKIKWQVWREEDGEECARTVETLFADSSDAAEEWAEEEDNDCAGELFECGRNEIIACVRRDGSTVVERYSLVAEAEVVLYYNAYELKP